MTKKPEVGWVAFRGVAGVEQEHFKALRRFVLAASRPCDTTELLAFRDSLKATIRGSSVFDKYVRVEVTGEVERMLVTRCTAARLGVKTARLAKELQRLWAHQLRYRYMEAHVLRLDQESVALNFLTQLGPREGFVTGAIVASIRHRVVAEHAEDDPDDAWVT